LLKSVGHSTMALTEIVAPYLDNPDNQSWRSAMSAYRARRKAAVDGLDATPMPAEPRHDCLTKGSISSASLQEFAKKQSPLLKRNIAWAAQTQVGHWMKVIGDWKTMLGSDWDKAYAASNTIYVARQNNILFSVLAQYFGPEAINHRLMLIETISFTSTPDDMLTSLTRIIADRSVGALFFGNLRADGGRRARRGHRGGRKAWDEAVPSAGRAVRLETMADADYAGTWPHLIGRCSLRSLNDRLGMGGARRAPVDRGTGNGLLSH
jgi:hypothetical protein